MAARISMLIVSLAVLGTAFGANAAGDLAAQKPIVRTVELGDAKGALRFSPDTLRLETGKLYQLRLVNLSDVAHYFSSEKLAAAVYTRKVQVNGADGKPRAEIKGHVREIEVFPEASAEWWFVPVKAGTLTDLRCTIAGHTEAGMKGRIVIE